MSVRIRQGCAVLLGACAALFFAASRADAQATVTQTTSVSSSDDHEGIGFVIKGGPLFSTLSTDIVSSPLDTRTGWIGGLAFGGNRPGLVGVQVDLLYARKKVATPTGDANLDYIDIPVLLRVNGGSSNAGGARVFGIGGPAFDVRLNGRLNFGSSFNDQTQGVDLGIAVGGGVEFARISLEGRYTKGLRDLGKDLTSSQKITTRTVAVMVGVRLN